MAAAHTTGCTADRPKSARRAGQPSYRGIAPRRCTPAAPSPAALGVVNVSERGRRWKEHDEAVKMVNFSRTKKPTKCDLDKNPREITGAGLVEPRE